MILGKLGNYTKDPAHLELVSSGTILPRTKSRDNFMVWRLISFALVLVTSASTVGAVSAQSRSYAPGVLTVIPPEPQYEETYSGPLELVEIAKGQPELDWAPNYAAKSRTVFEMSRLVVLRREVWNLEFAFKPLRVIYVDVPQESGKMQRKLIWYLVYRVRYLGGDMAPEPTKDAWGRETFTGSPVSREGRYFFPQFLLESHDFSKSYQDRIIPAARQAIQDREVRGEELLNSVEISQSPIPLSTNDDPHEVWGVATWEDIDPRIDFFSVFVKGLTNAYKPVDVPDVYKPGEPPGTGRELLAKTLQLNFWRPGDTIDEAEDQIFFGVPYSTDPARQFEIISSFGLKERLDYLWVYR